MKRKPNSTEIYRGIDLLNEILLMNNELKASDFDKSAAK